MDQLIYRGQKTNRYAVRPLRCQIQPSNNQTISDEGAQPSSHQTIITIKKNATKNLTNYD